MRPSPTPYAIAPWYAAIIRRYVTPALYCYLRYATPRHTCCYAYAIHILHTPLCHYAAFIITPLSGYRCHWLPCCHWSCYATCCRFAKMPPLYILPLNIDASLITTFSHIVIIAIIIVVAWWPWYCIFGFHAAITPRHYASLLCYAVADYAASATTAITAITAIIATYDTCRHYAAITCRHWCHCHTPHTCRWYYIYSHGIQRYMQWYCKGVMLRMLIQLILMRRRHILPALRYCHCHWHTHALSSLPHWYLYAIRHAIAIDNAISATVDYGHLRFSCHAEGHATAENIGHWYYLRHYATLPAYAGIRHYATVAITHYAIAMPLRWCWLFATLLR